MTYVALAVSPMQFDPSLARANFTAETRCTLGGYCAPAVTYDYVFKTGEPLETVVLSTPCGMFVPVADRLLAEKS